MAPASDAATAVAELQELDRCLLKLRDSYGPDAFRAAIKRVTFKPPGRPSEPDWHRLRRWLELDARAWLSGIDPKTVRADYAIAKEIAREYPGQSIQSTIDRIRGKLRHRRRTAYLLIALEIVITERPWGEWQRLLQDLRPESSDLQFLVNLMGKTSNGLIRIYRDRIGEPPMDATLLELVDDLERRPIGGIGSGLLLEFKRQEPRP